MEALYRFPEAGAADDGVSTFVKARSRMLAVALHTLGNVAEAEDIVQEVWLRWQTVDRDEVRNAPAFLTTTAVRLAINCATGAGRRHDTSLELWPGEPIDPQAGPAILAERGQALEAAILLMLEKLSPMERAAYLLREAFNYSYRHIARVVGVSEANSRQLVTRARKHLADGRSVTVDTTQLQRITAAFIEATQKGDLAGLEGVLSADIIDSVTSKLNPRRCAIVRRDRRAETQECPAARPVRPRSVRDPNDQGSIHA